jgi:hypothetical protein
MNNMKNRNSVVIKTFLINPLIYRDYRDINNYLRDYRYPTQRDWNQTLLTRINEISSKMYKITRKSDSKILEVYLKV